MIFLNNCGTIAVLVKLQPKIMEEKDQKTVLATIKKILENCRQGKFIFRGVNKSTPKVSSSLYRKFCEEGEENKRLGVLPIKNENFSIFNVEKECIEKVKKHFPANVFDREILTKLQCYGAQTNLIDFSQNLHIALFFACNGEFSRDGRIIAARKDSFKRKEINDTENILIEPAGKNPRMIFQSSVFVHPAKGYLEKKEYKEIQIEKKLKKPFLDYLQKNFNIQKDTIYNDLQGFIENQKNCFVADIEFYRGVALQKSGELEGAVKHYDKAIRLDPKNAAIYYNRGNAKFDLRQYQEAIAYYDEAIELDPELAAAYYNRANVKFDLRQHKKALEDYPKKQKIRHSIFVC